MSDYSIYNGAYTGPEVDAAIARARAGGQIDQNITALRAAVGSPLKASTVAGMTDHSRIYVYTGTETGYTAGHWYYWSGTAWTDGGVYNAIAFDTDTTLSIPGEAADAAAVGAAIEGVEDIIAPAYDPTQTYAVGDYCIHSNNLYRCKTAITTAESWTAAHWTQVQVMPEQATAIGELKSALTDIATMSAEETGNNVSGWESGHNILSNGNFGTSTTFSATPEFIPLPDYADKVTYKTGAYSSFVATYSTPDESGFIERISVSANHSVDLSVPNVKYIRISVNSLDTTNASTIKWTWVYPLTQLPFNSRASDAITLADGTDLDDVTTPGNYKVLSAASAATMTGTPPITTTSYRLFVLQTIYGRLMQFAFLNTGASTEKLTVRFYNGTTWGDWLPFASKNDVDNAAKESFSLLHSNATVIANNTNLDTLTTAGNYKATNAATVATLVNLPAQVQAAFALKVVQLSQSQRLMQVLYEQTIATPVYRRYYNGSTWSEWLKEAKEEQLIDITNKIVTSSDYLTYFPNGLLSDAKPNTIWGIYDTTLFADAPIGDDWIGTAGRDGGSMRGTLFTFSQANRHDKVQTGLTQLFVGYRGPSFKPTLSYRIAVVSNDVYSWSNWSKFEENGYLHASNMIVYGGNMSATFSDMNDMPRNTICQLDLNLDGRDAEHTLANHPAPGVSCVAMCYAFSYTASHGKVQTVFTIDGRLYWRYGYTQSADDYRWTSWRLLTKDVPAIPEAPDTDGTYVLRCTVSNGTKTYTWVSV